MTILLPTYGNFGGNGQNDAWEQADNWNTWRAYGYEEPPTVGPDGSKSIAPPPPYMQKVLLAHTPQNAAFVSQLMKSIDRQPINDMDGSFLNHDLGHVADQPILNIWNHVEMGGNVYDALTAYNNGISWDGYLYGLASVPLIRYGGSAHEVVKTISNDAGAEWYEVTEVVVTAAVASSTAVDVYYTIHRLDDFGVFSAFNGIANFAGATWNNFSSAVNSAFSSMSGALSGGWQWIKNALHIASREAEPLLPDIEYFSFSSGDPLSQDTLNELDENADGVLDAADTFFARLGIEVDDVVYSLSGAGITGVDLDSVDIAAGHLDPSQIVAGEDFILAQPVYPPEVLATSPLFDDSGQSMAFQRPPIEPGYIMV